MNCTLLRLRQQPTLFAGQAGVVGGGGVGGAGRDRLVEKKNGHWCTRKASLEEQECSAIFENVRAVIYIFFGLEKDIQDNF
jgi:hypothetical protein